MAQGDPEEIARLNDELRTTFRRGQVLVTRGVSTSPYQQEVLEAVKSYRFHGRDENNPYGENDFGRVTVHGEDYFFKIDYYDLNLEFHSLNPSDPSVTRRVLTIMRADEY